MIFFPCLLHSNLNLKLLWNKQGQGERGSVSSETCVGGADTVRKSSESFGMSENAARLINLNLNSSTVGGRQLTKM